MPCFASRLIPAVVTLVVSLAHPPAATGQSQPGGPPITGYQQPSIVLVQPPEGGVVPHDRPIIVFRFAPGDPSDQLDLGSLRVVVDGRDVTALFLTTPNESWGPISAPGSAAAAGARIVTGRICSLRGACGSVTATVTVTAPAPADGATMPTPPPARKGILGALAKLTRKIIGP